MSIMVEKIGQLVGPLIENLGLDFVPNASAENLNEEAFRNLTNVLARAKNFGCPEAAVFILFNAMQAHSRKIGLKFNYPV